MNRNDHKQEHLRKILSKRIKEARYAKGLTQPELAQLIGSTDRNISNYETGYSYPSIEVLYKLSQELSTSIDYLFGITDNPVIKEEAESSDLTTDDYRIFDHLKDEENLYQFLAENPKVRIKYIYKIWQMMDEWKKIDNL